MATLGLITRIIEFACGVTIIIAAIMIVWPHLRNRQVNNWFEAIMREFDLLKFSVALTYALLLLKL